MELNTLNSKNFKYRKKERKKETYTESPHFHVLELQHWKSVPRQVALPLEGPQRPFIALTGSITI